MDWLKDGKVMAAYLKAAACAPAALEVARRCAETAGGILAGTENAVKTAESVNVKLDALAERAAEDGKPFDPAEAVERRVDVVRFTIVAPAERFVEAFGKAMAALGKEGFAARRVKNHFSPELAKEGPYRGTHVDAASRDGSTRFEMQVHTPASLAAKEAAHALYEVERDPNVPAPVRLVAAEEMEALFDGVATPKGADLIASFGIDPDDAAYAREADLDAWEDRVPEAS